MVPSLSEHFKNFYNVEPEVKPIDIRFLNPFDKIFLDGEISPDEYLKEFKTHEEILEQRLMTPKTSYF